MSAEPNVNSLIHNELFTDSALINAKREALEIRTEQANRIIAKRMKQEEQMDGLKQSLSENEDEVKSLEKAKKEVRKSAGPDSVQQVRGELEVRLTKAKDQREQILKQLEESQANLKRLNVQEVKAKADLQKAEDEYTKELKKPVTPSKGGKAPTPGADQDKATGNALQQNEAILKSLQ
jgi:chromosome segregation ATPase